jgi:ketopantoate reductase
VQVKQAWAVKILNTKRWPEYVEMRARIYLRKQNAEITKGEVQNAIKLLRSQGSKKKKTRRSQCEGKLTEADILNAFVLGEEVC